MKNRVVVHIVGGNVQGIYSSDPDIEVEVFDEDNMEAMGLNGKQIEANFNKAIKGLKEINW